MPFLRKAGKVLQKLSAKAKKEIGFRKKIKELRNNPDTLPITIEEEGLDFADGAEDIFKHDQNEKDGFANKSKKKRKRIRSSTNDGDDRDSGEYETYKGIFSRVKTIDSDIEKMKNDYSIDVVFPSQKEALVSRIKDLQIEVFFEDNLVMKSKFPVKLSIENVEDDSKREECFLSLAKEAFDVGSKLCAKHKIPFQRPSDYYAEMIKSDEHMNRVRSKILNETLAIEASEKIRHDRLNIKFGKRVQVRKLVERQNLKSKNLKLIEYAKKRKTIDNLIMDTD